MKRIILLVSFFVFTFAVGNGQPKEEILTNKTIIDLTKAGLSSTVVISKIAASKSNFDVSAAALIALKKVGIADNVINAMVEKTSGISAKSNSVNATTDNSTTSTINNKPKIEALNFIHTYYGDTFKPLEKVSAASESKSKMMGYGGNNLQLEIAGTSSSVKLSDDQATSFIINMGSNNLPDYVLYKLKVQGGKRVAVVGKLTISGPKSGDKVISVDLSKLSEGVYILKPAQKLEKGEYFFATKPNLNTSTSSADVYAFSVI